MKKEKIHFYLGNGINNELGTKSLENQYDNEEYVFDINNENDAHASIARLISDKATVLDVGCATGITGELLSKFKNCTIDGIELDKEAIKIAKKRNNYRNLYNFSITDQKNSTYKKFFEEKAKYDYIIFCDVLEHLIDPDIVLLNFLKKLKKNGKILVSIPNIANIDIIRALINGEFNYQSLGILDRTHLRFFTTSSFCEMIYNVADREKINLDVRLCDQIRIKPYYVREESELFKLFNIDGDLNNFLVLQNIFEISYSDEKKRRKIKDKNNHSYFEHINDYLDNEKHQFWKTIADLNEENARLRKELGNHNRIIRKIKKVFNKK